MLCLKRVTKKTAGLLLVTAIAVSMITPATVFAFDDAAVVKSLLARRDVNVSLACFVNGKLCTIMIPAGADLSDIINSDGTIDIEKLAKKFGKTEVR